MQTLPISHPVQAASEHFDATQFLGLAPFLRMSIAGDECTDIAQELVTRAQQNPDDAVLWMNLSTVMLCLQRTDLGLTIQNQALAMQQVYTLNAAQQPAKMRLLMLMVPGTLSANVPLDCLLENSDIELIYYYITPEAPFEAPIPEHDVLMVAISATTENLFLLQQLESITRQWPVPVINAPQHIPNSERHNASTLLQNQPGLTIAQAHPVTFSALSALPEVVLTQVEAAIKEVPEVGLSILGISHRSDWFAAIVEETENNIRTLLGLSKDFHILFLQGGAT